MTAANLQNLFLREKSFENYSDNSILELILSTAGIKGNITSVVNDLLDNFGSLKSILEARPEQLMRIRDITKRAATILSMVLPLAKVWERSNMQNPGLLDNQASAEAYCKSLLMGERSEQFYVIALNCRGIILGTRKISDGTLSEVTAYPRVIVETALSYNAQFIIITHNHPGGTNMPSKEDIASTKEIMKTLDSLDITLADHIIIAGSSGYSMRQHGDLEPENNDSPKQSPAKKKSKKKANDKKK